MRKSAFSASQVNYASAGQDSEMNIDEPEVPQAYVFCHGKDRKGFHIDKGLQNFKVDISESLISKGIRLLVSLLADGVGCRISKTVFKLVRLNLKTL